MQVSFCCQDTFWTGNPASSFVKIGRLHTIYLLDGRVQYWTIAVLSGFKFTNAWNVEVQAAAGTSPATITNGYAWKYGLASMLHHQVKMQPFSVVIFYELQSLDKILSALLVCAPMLCVPFSVTMTFECHCPQ